MFVVFFLCRLLDPSGEWFPLNFSLCLGYSCQNTVIGWDLWKTGLEWKFMCMLFMGAKSLQSCPTLCDAMDCSLSGSSVHELLEAKILEWVVVPSSRCISDPRISTPPPPAISCFDMQVLHNQCVWSDSSLVASRGDSPVPGRSLRKGALGTWLQPYPPL